MKQPFFHSGYVILISFLVVSAASLMFLLSGVLFGISATQTSRLAEESAMARSLADFCAEEALQQIRDSLSFTGANSFNQGGGSCGYAVSNLSGSIKQITASGTVNLATRKVKVLVRAVNPKLIIDSWQEVADF